MMIERQRATLLSVKMVFNNDLTDDALGWKTACEKFRESALSDAIETVRERFGLSASIEVKATIEKEHIGLVPRRDRRKKAEGQLIVFIRCSWEA